MDGRGETESSARAETRCMPGRLEASRLSVVIITDLRRNAPSRDCPRCFFVTKAVLAVGSIPVESDDCESKSVGSHPGESGKGVGANPGEQ
jgi:hypothetical protein